MRFPVESIPRPIGRHQLDAVCPLARDQVAGAADGPADGVVRGALEFDAVVAVAECRGAGGVGADAVPLHQVRERDAELRRGSEPDAFAGVAGDDVPRARHRPPDRVVRARR